MAEEKNFETRIKNFLESEGIYALGTAKDKMKVPPCGYYEKRWGGGFSKSGLPDLHIIVRGISIEAEIKASNGSASDLQKQKLKQIVESGAIGGVFFPKDFDDLKKIVLRLKEGGK